MKEERLFRIIGDVDDDLVEDAARKPARPAFRLVTRWGTIAACFVLVLGLSLTQLASKPQLLPQSQEPTAARAEITPFPSPMGVRKFLNYNGYRYALMEDGAPYDLSELPFTGSLGILEHDILQGMDGYGDNEAASLDLAATFALGGEIYQLPGYDPAFRLAVVWEGETYLAELVGRVDNQPLDAGYFFTVSEIESHIRRIEILPHMGGEALSTVKKAQSKKLVKLLADARPAEMTETDYLALADAQSAGRSWQLALCLDDGTAVNIYLAPDLGFVSIGDNTYVLPETFQEQWGHHFDGLIQNSVPLR